MMKRMRLLTVLLVLLSVSACDVNDIDQMVPGLTDEEVAEGLRSALLVGTDTSVSILSAKDGYFGDELVKILLPEEASEIYTNLSKVPGGDLLMEQAILAINRSAEDAAASATPIFIDAISEITIVDGFAILNGEDNAATLYLLEKTYTDLEGLFKPVIGESLNKKLVGNVSAESAYLSLVNAYNTASLNGVLWDKINTNTLTEHATAKGLDGLFLKIALEEYRIRTNVKHRVNDILLKVFGNA